MISEGSLGLEFHDSSLHSVDFAGQKCLIALRPAYVYEVDAHSRDVTGACAVVDVTFELDHVALEGDLGELPTPILDGSLIVGSDLHEGLIPAPFESKENLTMRLYLWPDYREIAISARGLKICLDGVPRPEDS
jgi:hypothetical protein